MRSVVFACAAALTCAGVFGVSACSGNKSATDSSPADSTEGLSILFPAGYSAVDGTHDFKLPATVSGVKGVKWSVSDPSLVDIEVQNGGSDVMLTMKAAGTVTVYAKAGGLSASATVTISQATSDQYEAGKARYNDGVVWKPGQQGQPDPSRKLLACTNCHSNGGADIEHTPTQTGGYTDQDLVKIFTQGVKPDGVPQRVMPFDKWHQIHQWQMTDTERDGLVVYLRALAPKAQGPTDFGGMHGGGHHDGGYDHGGSDGGP